MKPVWCETVNWIHVGQNGEQWYFCRHGNERSFRIKCEEFIDQRKLLEPVKMCF
jgi:hypothetical protein